MNEERLKKLLEWEEQKPDDAFLKFAIAQEYVSGSRFEEALKYYEDLFTRFPDYLPTYYQLGNLLQRQNESERAIEIYKNGTEVAKQVNDFKTLRELQEAINLLKDE